MEMPKFELLLYNMNIIRTMSFLFYSTDYGKLYINKITKIACDKLGAENRRGTKTHTILVFDKKILSKTAKIYRSDRRINTKSVEIQDDAPDARDTSWMDREPFHIAKEDDYRNFFSVVNPEDNKGETDTVFKNDSADPLNASPVSSASLDYPTDCYYCDQMFTGSKKSEYERHVVNLHPGKPGYPGLADIDMYGLKSKGYGWER